MTQQELIQVIHEELLLAEDRIKLRILEEGRASGPACEEKQFVPCPQKALPENENYAIALESYLNGGTHSGLAKKLGISINAVKKYHNWLIKHGYLPAENAELSETEQKVVQCLFKDKLSLAQASRVLNCSVSNVVYRRDSAIRKGYVPPFD